MRYLPHDELIKKVSPAYFNNVPLPIPEDLTRRKKRVAIYARYSTSKQKQTSIERQVENGYEYANEIEAVVVDVYIDEERTGSTPENRDGLARLLEDLKLDKFDIVLIEEVDRLARDCGDIGEFRRRFKERKVEIHSKRNGRYGSEIMIWAWLAEETRTLMVERMTTDRLKAARKGNVRPPRCYGYEPDPWNRGRLRVYEPEAAVVRFIFALAYIGFKPEPICAILNELGIPAPNGGLWTPGTLLGNSAILAGMLRNLRYMGIIVYCRTVTIKRRNEPPKLELNPRDQWIQLEDETLIIVPPDIFNAVLEMYSSTGKSGGKQQKVTRLLSNTLFCKCGSTMFRQMTREGKYRLHCNEWSRTRRCSEQGRTAFEDLIIHEILQTVRGLFGSPELARAFVEEYFSEISLTQATNRKLRSDLKRRIAAETASLHKIFDTAIKTIFSPELVQQKVDDITKRIEKLTARLEILPSTFAENFEFDENKAVALADRFDAILTSFDLDPTSQQDRELILLFQELIKRVEFHPNPRDYGFKLLISVRVWKVTLSGKPDTSTEITFERNVEPISGAFHENPVRATHFQRVLASGAADVPDDIWEIVRPYIPSAVDRPTRSDIVLDARAVFGAALVVARGEVPVSNISAHFGPPREVEKAVIRLVRLRVWDLIADRLQSDHPEVLEGVSLSAFDNYLRKRLPTGMDWAEYALMARWVAEGRWALTDQMWETIKPMVPNYVCMTDRMQQRLDGRTLVDAILFRERVRRPFRDMPPVYASARKLEAGLGRLVRCGAWRLISNSLRVNYPAIFANADLNYIGTLVTRSPMDDEEALQTSRRLEVVHGRAQAARDIVEYLGNELGLV